MFLCLLFSGQNSSAATLGSLSEVGIKQEADLAFSTSNPTSALHVSKNGDDSFEGSEEKPMKTIQRALDQQAPGQAIVLHDGTYQEHLRLSKAGRPDAPMFLIAKEGASPVIVPAGSDKPILHITGSYYVVSGIRVDAQKKMLRAVMVENANHIALRDLDIGNGQGPSALYLRGSDLGVISSLIHDYKWPGHDAHGMIVVPDSNRILVLANESFGNDGDSLQCIGPDTSFGNAPARNILVEGNVFHEDEENAVDIKTCEDITIRGNQFHGYRPKSTAPQGSAMVVHYAARNILIENNTLFNNGRGLSLGGVMVGNRLAENVAVRKNVMFDHTTEAGGTGDGLRVGSVKRVEFSGNTFFNMPKAAIKAGDGDSGPVRTPKTEPEKAKKQKKKPLKQKKHDKVI
jgi:parallel beta-helix repeat protein